MEPSPNIITAAVSAGCPISQIGPVRIAVLTEAEAVRRVNAMIDATGERIVAFCNAHSVNLARKSPALRDAYARSLVLNDGIGVDLARKWLEGEAFPANLAGTDFLTRLLCERRTPLSLYLLGSKPGVGAATAAGLSVIAPQHRVVGMQDGYFTPDQANAVVADIVHCKPDIVLVGMGQPQQEIWAADYAVRTGAMVICVGAYLDFVAGVFPRAPALLRMLRAEWLYRLILEPRRLFSRYVIGNPKFLLGILRDRSKSEIKQSS